ncbi:MAG: conserved exported protein of unknown function [Promethearchaeota archaeon]|nr:MAG: conserved exported protein of unknown function [Candidatus Lokiarchaeota archaeon]
MKIQKLPYNKSKRNAILPISLLIVMILNIAIAFHSSSYSSGINLNGDETIFNHPLSISSSYKDNKEIIEELLNTKIQNYSDLDYFPQRYKSSIQAIYYALSILDFTGSLREINQSFVSKCVLEFYDNDKKMFMDAYAIRYLDTDADQLIYPYSSLLEINCYAVLTLDLLNASNRVERQDFINFIWSCFNYEYGGFIGQPFSDDLESYFKIPTLDSTYFAMLALDRLNLTWSYYTEEIDLIAQFIDSLQVKQQAYPTFGGFYNDPSLYGVETTLLIEPNMHTSYYALKSLDIINLVDIVDLNSFIEFHSSLYKEDGTYFVSSRYEHSRNFTNVAATAMGLEISKMLGWQGIDKSGTLNFLRTHRNELGVWKSSSGSKTYELIDTYQVIRSLYNSDLLSNLSSQELNEITIALTIFKQHDGYSLISKEYNTVDLIYSVVRTSKLFDRISDLEIASLYDQLSDAYKDGLSFDTFYYFTHHREPIRNFRTYPIEFFSSGKHELSEEIGRTFGHKAAYKALKSMLDLYKLDDFEIDHDLTLLLEDIYDSQFLNADYENFGGFMPYALQSDPVFQNSIVFMEHSYYAIKSMKFLIDYLNLGNLTSQPFDKDALYTFIFGNVIETPEEMFFLPNYPTDNVGKLQNTYYMVYVLKALDMFDLNVDKLERFVKNSLDYSNIKNLYYCFKLDSLLDLNIEYNILEAQNLVKIIYEPLLKECFVDSNKKNIDQNILIMLSEMALEDNPEIFHQNSEFPLLGHQLSLNVSLSNIILNSFGSYITVTFESDTIGTITLDSNPQGFYSKNILIPVEKQNFPQLDGTICIYYKDSLLESKQISILTDYEIDLYYSYSKQNKSIDFYLNASIQKESGTSKLYNSSTYALVYKDINLLEKLDFDKKETPLTSEFEKNYEIAVPGNYNFEIYLKEGFSEVPTNIFNTSYCYEGSDLGGEENEGGDDQKEEESEPQEESPSEDDENDEEGEEGSENDSQNGDSNIGNNGEIPSLPLYAVLLSLITIPSIGLTFGIYKKKEVEKIS